MSFSPDGKRLAAGGGDQAVKLWEMTIGQEGLTLEGHDANVTDVQFSSDGTKLVSASSDGVVKVWDTKITDVNWTSGGY